MRLSHKLTRTQVASTIQGGYGMKQSELFAASRLHRSKIAGLSTVRRYKSAFMALQGAIC